MQAPIDQNRVGARLGVLYTDGITTVPISCGENNSNAMMVNTTASVSIPWPSIAPEDENYKDCMMFTGSDGKTYPWAVDEDGAVLIDT